MQGVINASQEIIMYENHQEIISREEFTTDEPRDRVCDLVIRGEVWFDPSLTGNQKLILALTRILEDPKRDGLCYASNKKFAKHLKVSEKTISREIKNLVDIGYLQIVKFDGRVRWMKTKENQPRKFVQSDWTKSPIDTSIDTSSLSKDKQRFVKTKRIVKSGIKKTRRVIKIKPVDKNITKLIDYWNSLGQPFAKVVKREPVEEVLQKVLKDNKPIEIESIFNIAHSYFNNPYFIFAGSKIRCHDFFVTNIHGFMGKWVKENKFDNWFEVFLIKGDRWLDLNLLKQPKDIKKYSKELYNSIAQVLQTNPTSRDDQIIIKRIANRMESWLSLNNIRDYQWPLVDDFQYYLREKHSDLRKVKNEWFVSRNFWNKSFNEYLVKIGRFNHINQIKRI